MTNQFALQIHEPLIILVGGAFLFLRWLAQRAARGSEENDGPNDASASSRARRNADDSDEERVRRFMEALGQPTGSRPPPKITPRTPPQIARPVETTVTGKRAARWGNPLPPLTTAPPPLVNVPKQSALAPAQAFEPFIEKVPVYSPTAGAPSSPVALSGTAAPTISSLPDESIGSLLRSPAGLRNASILREVFGPPRSLQSLDRL